MTQWIDYANTRLNLVNAEIVGVIDAVSVPVVAYPDPPPLTTFDKLPAVYNSYEGATTQKIDPFTKIRTFKFSVEILVTPYRAADMTPEHTNRGLKLARLWADIVYDHYDTHYLMQTTSLDPLNYLYLEEGGMEADNLDDGVGIFIPASGGSTQYYGTHFQVLIPLLISGSNS